MSGEEIKKRRMIECPEISRTDMNLPAAELKTEEYEIELITPMVGGGVEAGEVDPEMPVRASEIKGHLRFWWRVWKGGAFSKTEEMFKEESKIWGSTENPSSVILNVERLSELGVSKISDILKVEKVSEATAFQQQKT
ncbi:MAG: type III-B CRISPR module RAMP protein Cmr1, partial [Thermoplasmata archaeon]